MKAYIYVMKVTRYVQSCLLVESGPCKILIDPSGEDRTRDFGKLDAVLYTHEHADHFDPDMAKKFIDDGLAVYANTSTAKLINADANQVKDGDEFDINGVKIKVIEMPHCPLPDGSEGPQNVGYLFHEVLLHPGDAKEINWRSIPNLAWPITGPDISPRDAFDFARQVDARIVIPIHYDVLGTKPEWFVQRNKDFNFGLDIRPLQVGESTELLFSKPPTQ